MDLHQEGHSAALANLGAEVWVKALLLPYLSRNFFHSIAHPSSSLHFLLPPPRDPDLLARLPAPTKFPRIPTQTEQEAQLMLTTGAMRLAVSRGQQTWYHFGSVATFR